MGVQMQGLVKNEEDLPYPGYEECDVLGGYMGRKGPRSRKRRPEGERTCDPILPELIGCAKPKELYEEINPEYGFVREGLAALLGHNDPELEDVASLGDAPKGKEPTVSAVLQRESHQLTGREGAPGLLRAAQPGEAQERCGVFDVDKEGQTDKDGKQLVRIVFNAVPGNARLKRIGVQLYLFLLPMLLSAFTSVCQEGGYVLNIDMRHMYYQWPWSEKYARYFAVPLQGLLYIPRVLIMGYHSACAICQCALWGVVLFRRRGANGQLVDSLGIRPHEVSPDGRMPRIVWLYEEDQRIGAIVVLLDGVFLFTSRKALRDEWKARLEENCARFNVVKKDQGAEKETCDAGNAVTFSGIEFKPGPGGGFRPATRGMLAIPVPTTVGDVASIVGSLLWDVRVRLVNVLDHPTLLALARQIGGKDQEAPFALYKRDRRGLQPLLEIRARPDFIYTPKAEMPTRICLAATDATRSSRAAVRFAKTGAVQSCVLTGRAPPAKTAREGRAPIASSGGCGLAKEQVHQEFDAVVELATALADEADRDNVPRASVALLVAIDADPVRKCIDKMYSQREEMQKRLRILRQTGIQIYTTRVSGDDNLADQPSRGEKPADERRREATFRVIRALSISLFSETHE